MRFYFSILQCGSLRLFNQKQYFLFRDTTKYCVSVSCSTTIAWKFSIIFIKRFFARVLLGTTLINLRLVFICVEVYESIIEQRKGFWSFEGQSLKCLSHCLFWYLCLSTIFFIESLRALIFLSTCTKVIIQRLRPYVKPLSLRILLI